MGYNPGLEIQPMLGSGAVENRYQKSVAWEEYEQYLRDRMNLGELDRWADDGGRA